MTRSIREKTNCILVKWCCLDNRQRQMWATMQLWQQIFSNSSPMFCMCHCLAIACDFPLILRNGSVLFSCLTVTLVLQCHFYWNLLCSNHRLVSPLPLPPAPLSLWQIPPCPVNVVSAAAAHTPLNQSHLCVDSASNSGLAVCVDVEGTEAQTPQNHLHHQKAIFLSITLHVTGNVEMSRKTSSKGNYESSIHRPMWPIRIWM